MLVDAITEHEPGRRLVAVKNVTVNEEFFQGHFPGAPLMPGVLMLESLSQVAAMLLLRPRGRRAQRARLPARRQRREIPAAGRPRRPAAAGNRARTAAGVARARTGDCVSRRSGRRGVRPPAGADPRHHRDRLHRHRPPIGRDWPGNDDRSARHHRTARAARCGLPDRRVGGHRRLDRDRRGDRDLSVRVDRPHPAGLEVSRRGHPPGDRQAQYLP